MSTPAVFIDRDGTLIEHFDYLTDPDQVRLLPNAAKALRQLRQRGFALVMVTNQSAVARGMITEETLLRIHDRLKSLLSEQGAYLDQIYYCPFHPDGAVEQYRKESDQRKPAPGMLLTAADEMDLDLTNSWMVGDDSRDIGAGQAAGCRTILLDSHSASPLVQRNEFKPDFRAVNLQEAANLIFRQQTRRQDESKTPQKQTVAVAAAQSSNAAVSPQPPLDTPAQPESSPQPQFAPDEPAPPEQPQLPNQPTDTADHQDEDDTPQQANVPSSPPDDKAALRRAELAERAVRLESHHGPDDTESTDASGNRPRRLRPKRKITADPEDSKRSQELLAEILRELKVAHRQQGFSEFSAAKLVAGLTQMIVIGFLILAFSSHISVDSSPAATQTSLLAAIVFQVMTLTLLVMHRH
ncbi:MAG: HAD-IIIA family hydrolase [Sedimentisphaerales bacterium]|nr:HAD-IIIA family hydrolase [Sedimentisphaerales bacterium]